MSLAFQTFGVLRYTENPFKLIVTLDPDLGAYYRSLIPKYVWVQPPKWKTHVSVVRKETPRNMSAWKKYEGRRIDVEYDNFIYEDDTYLWLNAFSPVLQDLRTELGLRVCSGITQSPDGRHKFHITIANKKGNTPV